MEREPRRSSLHGAHHLLFSQVDEVSLRLDPVFLKDGNSFVLGKSDADIC